MNNREDRIGTERAAEYIDGRNEAWTAYAHEIAENYEEADGRMVLYIAPAHFGVEQWVYVETNGDPIVVGWFCPMGGAELIEDETTLSRLLPGGDLAWTRERLEVYGFDLPDAEDPDDGKAGKEE